MELINSIMCLIGYAFSIIAVLGVIASCIVGKRSDEEDDKWEH